MFIVVESVDAGTALTALHTARDAVNALPLHCLSDEDLLTVLRDQEAEARRAAVSQHAVIAELEARGTARERGAVSTAAMLSQLLRIAPLEAGGRVIAAGLLGPRRGLSGAVLPPLFEKVAAAQAAGQISPARMPGSSPPPSPPCPMPSGAITRTGWNNPSSSRPRW